MHTNKDVVSPDVQVIGPDATFAEAAQYKVRRLPIVNREKRLVGIVALGDIAVKEPEPAPAAKRCRRSSYSSADPRTREPPRSVLTCRG